MNTARRQTHVLANRRLAPGTCELEIERGDFQFRAGEELILHGAQPEDDRTYSIASGEEDPTLKLLVRIIPAGRVSPRLAALRQGDTIAFTGPTGSFVLRDEHRPLVFIATGTGIAPLLSFLRTKPQLRPTVLHGVRDPAELYARAAVEPRCAAYLPCVSRDPQRPRRVTDVLPHLALNPQADYYLCGGHPMIRDARALLLARGIPAERIRAEAYFYW